MTGIYIYEDNDTTEELKFFNQPEGYVKPTVTSSGVEMTYSYQYKDHLGNIRLSYSDTDNNGAVDSSEIIEEKNYYPFGLVHKGYNNVINGTAHNYGFGGKEEQKELGLNWIDITARNYDPALGRWMNLDPLAEKMRKHSPYNFAFNNPIYFQDYDGMTPTGNGEDPPKKNRRTIVNTFKYDTNAAGNKIKTGTDTVTDTHTYNSSSKNDLGQSVYTTTSVSSSLTVDAKANIGDTASVEVKITVVTMTDDGAKATFTSEKSTVSSKLVSEELQRATNDVAELKSNDSEGLYFVSFAVIDWLDVSTHHTKGFVR